MIHQQCSRANKKHTNVLIAIHTHTCIQQGVGYDARSWMWCHTQLLNKHVCEKKTVNWINVKNPVFFFQSSIMHSWTTYHIIILFGATTFLKSIFSCILGTSAIRYAHYIYGRSSLQPPYLTSLLCSGLENQLLSCRYSIGSSHWSYAVGVRCYGNKYSEILLHDLRLFTNGVHFSSHV